MPILGSRITFVRYVVLVFTFLMPTAYILYGLQWGSSADRTKVMKKDRQLSFSPVVRFATSPLFDQKEVDFSKLAQVPNVTEVVLASYTMERFSAEVEVHGKKMAIFTVQIQPKVSPPKNTLLLLHGMGTSSLMWLRFNTMQMIAHWGFRVIAVDLPGFGSSEPVQLGDIPKEDFMEGLTKTLGLHRPIIVASSNGGTFALPYLFKTPGAAVERATALVAEACAGADTYKDNYPKSQLPTLILYGDQDERIGVYSRERLQLLPRSNIVVLPNVGHGALGHKPDLYHKALYSYLMYVTDRH